MSYHDIDPQDIDPDTGRPYSNYSSPSLDTSFHDAEMDIDGPTYTVRLIQRITGMTLDTKSGEDLGELLRAYADEGCLSGGDTLQIIDNTEED